MAHTAFDARKFVSTFHPYRNRYTELLSDEPDLWGNPGWSTRRGYLSNRKIQAGIDGDATYGYVICFRTPIIGIDIDDHFGKAWAAGTPSLRLCKLYDEVVVRFGFYPSLLFASLRGLHVYYLLDEFMPSSVMHEHVKSMLAGVSVEFKPTPHSSLRLPRKSAQLDPYTFKIVAPDIHDVPTFSPVSLFMDAHTPRVLRATYRERRSRIKTAGSLKRILELEEQLIPTIRAHCFNEQKLDLALVYFRAGMSVDEAEERFGYVLTMARYHGMYHVKPQHLKTWLRWEWKHLEKRGAEFYTGSYSPNRWQPGLFDVSDLENLVCTQPFARQRTGPIRRFVNGIMAWRQFQEDIKADKGRYSLWSYIYSSTVRDSKTGKWREWSFYRQNRDRGYFPLPRNLLKGLNQRYNQLLPWLIERAVLEPAPFTYSPNDLMSVCKYYRIQPPEALALPAPEQSPVFVRVRELAASGMTQTQIADLYGVNQRAISYWLSGKRVGTNISRKIK